MERVNYSDLKLNRAAFRRWNPWKIEKVSVKNRLSANLVTLKLRLVQNVMNKLPPFAVSCFPIATTTVCVVDKPMWDLTVTCLAVQGLRRRTVLHFSKQSSTDVRNLPSDDYLFQSPKLVIVRSVSHAELERNYPRPEAAPDYLRRQSLAR